MPNKLISVKLEQTLLLCLGSTEQNPWKSNIKWVIYGHCSALLPPSFICALEISWLLTCKLPDFWPKLATALVAWKFILQG